METLLRLPIKDSYVRSESIVPIVLSLRPDCPTKISVTETILTLETIIWKPGLYSGYVCLLMYIGKMCARSIVTVMFLKF